MESKRMGYIGHSLPYAKGMTVLALILAAALIGGVMLAPVVNTVPNGYFLISHFTVTVRIHHAVPGLNDAGWVTIFEGKPNTLTTIGKDFIEQQISGTSNTSQCIYIALSEAADTPAAGWLKLPSEISGAGGLDRQTGTYASTGAGAWTVIKTFACTGSYTVKLTGLHWKATDDSDGNILAAVQFTTPVTLINGDSLEVTWTCSVA